jgi:hypothetical protein
MDILRNLFGNLTSGLIRLLVAVGVLGAAYLFIIKPVLHTTENVTNTVNNSIENAHKEFERSFGPNSEASKAIRKANKQVQVQITRSFHQTKTAQSGNTMKLLHCIQHVAPDVDKMQRCNAKFAP